jgi:hypothetical protein
MTNTILTKTTIALAAALMLGGATAALANDIDESASSAQAAREWQQYLNQKAPSHLTNAGAAYGFYQGNQTHKAHQTR